MQLLAPAGNLSCGIIAAESGADAIYAGFSRFNARQMAKNFSLDDLSRLSEFLKRKNKKLYLTLNTLIKETELEDFYKSVEEASSVSPDAFIVQDLGVLQILKDYFPHIPVHASTQMGIHNSAGVEIAKDLGFSRVILERQITREELKIISQKSPLELEVFAHGALCCSLSGVCLFSSSLGGFSGNRGLCKQPCRRRYFSSDGRDGFFFSPKDLETIEMIDFFKEIGIASLKIEGRLKREDYVANVVQMYRRILDSDSEKILSEVRDLSESVVQRKKSYGFYTKKSMENLIEADEAGNFGNLVGKILKADSKGFEFEAFSTILKGDRVRLQSRSGEDGHGLTMVSMYRNRKPVARLNRGDRCFVPSQLRLKVGDSIFKIASSVAGQNRDFSSLPMYKKSHTVNLSIFISAKKIMISTEFGEWFMDLSLEVAKSKSLNSEFVSDFFKNSIDNKYLVEIDDVCIEGELFFPTSIMKNAKREFWSWFDALFIANQLQEEKRHFDANCFSCRDLQAREIRQDVYYCNDHSCGVESSSSIYKIAKPLEGFKEASQVVLPFFVPEFQLEKLTESIDDAYRSGIRDFRITNLFHFAILKKYNDIEISQGFPLPICNSFAVEAVRLMGLSQVQAWVELDRNSRSEFCKKSSLPVEIPVEMRLPLLVTRAKINVSGEILDERQNEFIVESKDSLFYVYSKNFLKLEEEKSCSKYFEAASDSLKTTDFNFSRNWE
ncbi:MAG: U32 family peptidase [Spirochaetales bacterium]|nr:U32 family peptidase [Spirochaetales bacterium]